MADTWTDRLSDYVDDEVAPDERRLIEAHLSTCGECARIVDELRQVAARAAALTNRPPQRDLWPGVELRLDRGQPAPIGTFDRATRRFSFTIPQLVAAGLALMVLSGSAVWVAQHGGRATSLQPAIAAANPAGATAAPRERAVTVGLVDPHYDAAIADLQEALQNERAQLDPQTVRVLEQNLAAIDRAIDESRQALEKDPANIYLNRHLADARQRKLALLRDATAIATKGL